ncbi:hypothetical protein M426DRAFT_237114 [Hypoxylon sp. CI-4A]|nr:hypothetical protein M426DRAFT_237114 [Hypoxylon sp. CI-4A]
MALLTGPPATSTGPLAPLSTRDANVKNSQLVVLMSISLSMASISVLAALGAFYWFVRMRRSFRHDLIMLLIQSDMIKALWLVICPLAFFAKEPIDSRSTFCQVSGFFIATSIEASDVAVLLIAIHTALFILRPQCSASASGLYPYRRIAYACWAIIPLVLAAVVPITGGQFVDNGPHCYLPIRPRWYRSALSWIPRYVIFGVIIVTYTGLYLYLAVRFRRFDRDQRRASTTHSDYDDQPRKHAHRHNYSGDVPPTPTIADYGFLDSARESLTKDDDPRDRQNSIASTLSTLNGDTTTPLRRPEPVMRHSIKWNPVNFANDSSVESQDRRESRAVLTSRAVPSPCTEDASPIRAPERVHHSPQSSSDHGRPTWKRPMSFGSHSISSTVSNMISALRRGPPKGEGSGRSTSSSSIFLSRNETEESMRRAREKQRRQLRLLFVYPVVYVLTWIAPFIAHIIRYDDEYQIYSNASDRFLNSEPLALQVISIASLCIGAAVDCCFFSAWEKPWRHLRGGFWENLALRLRIWTPKRHRSRRMGRTREERFLDARTARRRRDEEENLESRSNGAAIAVDRRTSNRDSRRSIPPREWWDMVDFDSSESNIARPDKAEHDPSNRRHECVDNARNEHI